MLVCTMMLIQTQEKERPRSPQLFSSIVRQYFPMGSSSRWAGLLSGTLGAMTSPCQKYPRCCDVNLCFVLSIKQPAATKIAKLHGSGLGGFP